MDIAGGYMRAAKNQFSAVTRKMGLLLAALLAFPQAMSAKLPPRNIGVIVEGIGFIDPSAVLDVACNLSAPICVVKHVSGALETTFQFPGNLKTFGADCTQSNEKHGWKFSVVPGSIHSDAAAFDYDLQSPTCPSRVIHVRHSWRNRQDRDLTYAQAWEANSGWHICMQPTGNMWTCDPLPAVHDAPITLFNAFGRWAAKK